MAQTIELVYEINGFPRHLSQHVGGFVVTEGRLDELVDVCKQLKEENQSLKQRQDMLMSERASLLQKNEQVRARVEAMIGRLKAMETGG